MGIDIDVRVEPGHVYLQCKGTYSLAEAKRVFQKVVDSALECDRSRVLVDVFGVTGNVPTIDRYEVAVFLAEYIIAHALGKIWKIVVVGHEPPIDPDRFGETVAVNRGVNLGVTTNIDEAFELLKK